MGKNTDKNGVELEKGMRWKGDSIEYRPYLEIDGETVRSSFTGKTPKEVKKKRDRYLAGARIKAEAKKTRKQNTPTTYEIAYNWIELYKRDVVSYGNYQNYSGYLKNQIYKSNLDKPIDQVTPDDIQLFFNNRNWMSQSALNYLNIIINNVIKISIAKGYITGDPQDGITIPSQPQTPVYAFSDHASKLIFAFTFEHPFGLPVRTILTIGCRPGELIALQWPEIDLPGRSIHICRTLSKAPGGFEIKDTTKTKLARDAYIHDAIYDDFTVGKYIYNNRVKAAKKEKKPLPSPYVLTHKGAHMTYHAFEYHYRKFFAALNDTLPEGEKIEYKSPNKCRTTFATTMLKSAGDIRVTQVALGHQNVKTTQRYTNPTFDDLKQASKKLDYSDESKG